MRSAQLQKYLELLKIKEVEDKLRGSSAVTPTEAWALNPDLVRAWDALSRAEQEFVLDYYRRLVLAAQLGTKDHVDGELLIRMPGMSGFRPIKHIFRCETTVPAIHRQCDEFRTWLTDITRNFR